MSEFFAQTWTTVSDCSIVGSLSDYGRRSETDISEAILALSRQHKEYHYNKKILKQVFNELYPKKKPANKKRRR